MSAGVWNDVADEIRAKSKLAALRARNEELLGLLDRLLNDPDCAAGAELSTNGIARVYVKTEALDAARAALAQQEKP